MNDRDMMGISQAIFEKSVLAGEVLRVDISYPTEAEKNMMWSFIVFEYIYLFLHLVNRELFYSKLRDRRTDIMHNLGTFTVDISIKTMYEKLPPDREREARNDFIDRAQIVELDYGACKELLSKDEPFSDKAVFSRFGKEILKRANTPEDTTVMLKVMDLAMNSWIELRDLIQREIKNVTN
jgi:hypothetical protein